MANTQFISGNRVSCRDPYYVNSRGTKLKNDHNNVANRDSRGTLSKSAGYCF